MNCFATQAVFVNTVEACVEQASFLFYYRDNKTRPGHKLAIGPYGSTDVKVSQCAMLHVLLNFFPMFLGK